MLAGLRRLKGNIAKWLSREILAFWLRWYFGRGRIRSLDVCVVVGNHVWSCCSLSPAVRNGVAGVYQELLPCQPVLSRERLVRQLEASASRGPGERSRGPGRKVGWWIFLGASMYVGPKPQANSARTYTHVAKHVAEPACCAPAGRPAGQHFLGDSLAPFRA